MTKSTRLVLIVALILVGGSVVTAGWRGLRRSRPQQPRIVFGPPCPQGLVSAEPQPDAPVLLTIEDAGCDGPSQASVQFVAKNIGSSAISQFEIRALETYCDVVDQGAGVTSMGQLLYPQQTRPGFIGSGVLTVAGGKPVGPLKSYQLTVWSVTFADGKTWTRRAAA